MALKSASRSKKQLPDWARAVESLRLALKVTQAQLAELIGVSAPIVSQWESGARKPSPSVFVRMAKLARDPLAFQFWDFADIHASDVLRLVPEIEARIRAAVASDEDVVRVPLIVDLNQIPAPAIPIRSSPGPPRPRRRRIRRRAAGRRSRRAWGVKAARACRAVAAGPRAVA